MLIRNPDPTLREVIVNTKTDKAFRGVLWQRTRGYLVLRNVSLLRAREAPLAVDGEVVIDAANVDFIQVVTPGGRAA
jgi:small nuclear ribonucleoprotein (snRNP)-like protein